mmetsp:Transcript_44277/g.70782  ORF Transcript_44277/g.70782 Transcript_44277/m.70782 type:complete len:81 (+) Transcript_44277:1197-1439(+)
MGNEGNEATIPPKHKIERDGLLQFVGVGPSVIAEIIENTQRTAMNHVILVSTPGKSTRLRFAESFNKNVMPFSWVIGRRK